MVYFIAYEIEMPSKFILELEKTHGQKHQICHQMPTHELKPKDFHNIYDM